MEIEVLGYFRGDYLISKNLGQQNLLLQIRSGYIFNPSHAIALASNIDTLHALNIVHRDIKPENMFFYDGQFYLTDNESMDEVGNFKLGYGTPTYLAPVFMSNEYENNDKNSPLSAYKRDQYTFLMSMMTAYFKCQPKNGEFRLDLITHFVRAMPCNEVLKKELFFFIFQPELNQLSSPLAAYFSQIQTKFSSDYRHRLSPLSFNFKS